MARGSNNGDWSSCQLCRCHKPQRRWCCARVRLGLELSRYRSGRLADSWTQSGLTGNEYGVGASAEHAKKAPIVIEIDPKFTRKYKVENTFSSALERPKPYSHYSAHKDLQPNSAFRKSDILYWLQAVQAKHQHRPWALMHPSTNAIHFSAPIHADFERRTCRLVGDSDETP